MVGSRRPPAPPATTAAAANAKCKVPEKTSLDWEVMLSAGKILTKNGWIDGKDSESLVLICDEAKKALQQQKEQQREASHAPQIIPAK